MRIQPKFVSLSLLLFVLLWCSAHVQAQPAYKPDDVLKVDPAVTIGTLENGLTYYIKVNKKPEKRAELRLAVKVGSIVEDDDQQGLAHFCEHMAFNGTKSFPKQDLVNFLEKSGVRFGPELNAYTSFDETVYMLQVPTDSQAIMKKGFQILKEWGQSIMFEGDEIDKERGVLVEEWRLGRGADQRVWMKHIPLQLYKSHYADRIVIGKKEILESFKHDVLRRFYKDWYRPDLMALIAVGDFDKAEIEALIKTQFADLKNPKPERERKQFPVPDHVETLVSIATDAELTNTTVNASFKRATHDVRTVGEYRNEILGQLYDGMFNQRIQERIQKPNPPFVYGYGYDSRFIGEKQAYTLMAMVKENSILDGLEAILTEAFRVKQHGFTASELERQKASSLRWIERQYKERDKSESRMVIGELIRNFLVRETIPGIEVEFELYKQFTGGITVDEINKLAALRMSDGNRVITVSAPKKEGVKVPTEAEILALMQKLSITKLDPYIDKVSTEPLVSKMPKAGKVVNEKTIAALGVTEWKLSNGARVVLKPTDFKNDEILFSAYSEGGTSLVPDQDFLSASSASQVIGSSGVGEFDAIALQKKLAGKVASVSPTISTLSEGFTGSASPQDLETLLQLVYLYGTSPRKDTAAFSALMSRYSAMLQNRSVSPEGAFYDTVGVTMANYHYRARPMTTKLLEEVNLDKAVAVYKDRFADFSDFTFFVVGNFKLETIKPLVEQYLAALPSTNRVERWKDIGMKPPKGTISKQVYRGVEPKSSVQLVFTGPFEWSQQNRYDFQSMLEVLNIKLREVIREEKGGTYGVGAYGGPSLYPRQEYTVTVSWGCNPERVDELVTTALQVLDSLKLKKPDDIYIDKAKELQRRTYEVSLKQNNFWMSNFRTYYANNENPELMLNYPKLIENLRAETIQKAVQKYFDMKNYVKVVLYPEKK